MIETTVNKSMGDRLTSDKIYELFTSHGLKVLLISNEITPNSLATHFHCLLDNKLEDVPEELYNQNFIFREVRDEAKAVSYFSKEGKFKVYNGFKVPSSKKIDLNALVLDIKEGLSYSELLLKYGFGVMRYGYYIKLIKSEPRKIKTG